MFFSAIALTNTMPSVLTRHPRIKFILKRFLCACRLHSSGCEEWRRGRKRPPSGPSAQSYSSGPSAPARHPRHCQPGIFCVLRLVFTIGIGSKMTESGAVSLVLYFYKLRKWQVLGATYRKTDNLAMNGTQSWHVFSLKISVADPWHFAVDPDPNPRIHASDQWIRIRRIRIRIRNAVYN